MPLLVLAAALMSVAAEPIDRAGWFTRQDFPPGSARRGEEGFVLYRLTVSPAGQVQQCEVIEGSGFAKLDDRTCALARERARFKPASDDAGQPTTGVYRDVASWLTNSRSRIPRPSQTDLVVNVNQLPSGLGSPALVPVDFVVDASGKVESCAARPTEGVGALAKMACDQAMALLAPRPARGADGQAERSVQRFTVAFSTSPGTRQERR